MDIDLARIEEAARVIDFRAAIACQELPGTAPAAVLTGIDPDPAVAGRAPLSFSPAGACLG